MSGPASYRVVLAKPEHFDAIRAVERAAEEIVPLEDLPLALRGAMLTPNEELAEALRNGLLWCGLDARGEVVGFAIVLRRGHDFHLDEIDVHPAHQRRGIGRALVGAARARAVADGAARLTLTTFRFVPWNQPWYERLGFAGLAEAAMPLALREIYEAEIASGLARERRVAMTLELAR